MKKESLSKKLSEPILMHPTEIEYNSLTKSQKQAYQDILSWYHSKKNDNNQIYRLGGPAGTGKTFLIQYLLSTLDLSQAECYVVAYTGQAVNVLRQNGIFAKTIHSTFMEQYETILMKDGEPIIRRGIPVTITKFRPRKRISPHVKLVICDEASFLSKEMEKILRRYNVPILEVGDPFQLPPVNGVQCFHMKNLDFILRDIVRQGKGSEIIDLATRIRENLPIHLDEYQREIRFLVAQEDNEATFFHFFPYFKENDIILTVFNKDRTEITRLYRENIIKTTSPFPIKGERLICRRNEWNHTIDDFPLTNGTQGYAVHTVGKSEVKLSARAFFLTFRPTFVDSESYDGLICDTEFIREDFATKHSADELRRGNMKFEYAHVITTHLSQGSTYNSIIFMDRYLGYMNDPEYASRLRYTAITRAKNFVVYILPKSFSKMTGNIYKL